MRKRPIVGTSQSTATNARKMFSGSFPAARVTLATVRSLGSATTIGPASASAVAIL